MAFSVASLARAGTTPMRSGFCWAAAGSAQAMAASASAAARRGRRKERRGGNKRIMGMNMKNGRQRCRLSVHCAPNARRAMAMPSVTPWQCGRGRDGAKMCPPSRPGRRWAGGGSIRRLILSFLSGVRPVQKTAKPTTPSLPRGIALIGAPTDIGAGARGASMGPEALRVAGLGPVIEAQGFEVEDRGNLYGPANPWQPPSTATAIWRKWPPGTARCTTRCMPIAPGQAAHPAGRRPLPGHRLDQRGGAPLPRHRQETAGAVAGRAR